MIIFGGSDYDGSVVDCYVLQMANVVECKRISNLAMESTFWCCASPVFDGLCVYGSDSDRRVHIYSITENKWKVIE